MALKKDKQKVLGEVFDDERVKSFLEITPRDGSDADFQLLERAYRGMKIENFETFVKFFTAEGKNLNAKNEQGAKFIDVVKSHRYAKPYIDALVAAGAEA